MTSYHARMIETRDRLEELGGPSLTLNRPVRYGEGLAMMGRYRGLSPSGEILVQPVGSKGNITVNLGAVAAAEETDLSQFTEHEAQAAALGLKLEICPVYGTCWVSAKLADALGLSGKDSVHMGFKRVWGHSYLDPTQKTHAFTRLGDGRFHCRGGKAFKSMLQRMGVTLKVSGRHTLIALPLQSDASDSYRLVPFEDA